MADNQPNFGNLLDIPAENIKAPPPLPIGTYILTIAKYGFGESTEKKTPFVEIHYKIMGAGPDVDQSKLAEIEFGKREIRDTFYVTDDALYRLNEWLKKLGLSSGTVKERLPQTIGRSIYAYINQKPSRKPGATETFPEITNYTPAS